MHMATHRVRNMDRLGVDIGQISFVVPRIVLEELRHISDSTHNSNAKRTGALQAMKLADSLDSVNLDYNYTCDNDTHITADDLIVEHALVHGGMIATMDRQLKRRLREGSRQKQHCTIVSFSNDNIIIES